MNESMHLIPRALIGAYAGSDDSGMGSWGRYGSIGGIGKGGPGKAREVKVRQAQRSSGFPPVCSTMRRGKKFYEEIIVPSIGIQAPFLTVHVVAQVQGPVMAPCGSMYIFFP